MIFRVVFWLMLPVSVLQGLWLRKKATRLPGAPGTRQGTTGEGDALQLLAIGDSIIDGVGTNHIEQSLPVQFAQQLAKRTQRCVHWRVEGETGNDIVDVIKLIESLSRTVQADLVLISVGVNDVTGLTSTRSWRKKLLQLLDRLEQRWPGIHVMFAGLPPMSLFPLPPQPLRFTLGLRAATLDRIAAGIIAGYSHATHVPTDINPQAHDFCEDGFHPSAESCTLWARELAIIESRRESA